MRIAARASRIAAIALPLALLAAPSPAAAHGHDTRQLLFDRDGALAYSQRAIGGTLGDHRLIDPDGRVVDLFAFRGKPLVVNLIYTSCAHGCPLTVQSLRRAVEVAQGALGRDAFAVITVGFDSRNDTPARMRAYARSRGIDRPGWSALAADQGSIERLAAKLGFLFAASPAGFDHLAQTTIVDAQGRVYRQVYGETFAPPSLVEPLKDLVLGRSAGLTTLAGIAQRVRWLCTVYDPASDRYRFSYAVLLQYGIGALSLTLTAIFLFRAWRQARRAA
jgi:protein SCO1/2